MGYKLNGEHLEINVPFKDSNGASYPANWIVNASKSELAAVPTGGITWVDEPSYDQRFYWGPSKPKDIATLKTLWIQAQKDTANTLLAPTDWMVVRAAEGGTALPSDTKTERAAIRTKCKEREDQITACSDTAALDALLTASPTLRGTASNGATEIKKEVLDSEGKSKDPKEYESYDPKQWNNIVNSAAIKAWPTE